MDIFARSVRDVALTRQRLLKLGLALLGIVLVAGLFKVREYWDDASHAQILLAALAFTASMLSAALTLVYVLINQRSLELLREQFESSRPHVNLRVVKSQVHDINQERDLAVLTLIVEIQNSTPSMNTVQVVDVNIGVRGVESTSATFVPRDRTVRLWGDQFEQLDPGESRQSRLSVGIQFPGVAKDKLQSFSGEVVWRHTFGTGTLRLSFHHPTPNL
jgi:hypothetical protein